MQWLFTHSQKKKNHLTSGACRFHFHVPLRKQVYPNSTCYESLLLSVFDCIVISHGHSANRLNKLFHCNFCAALLKSGHKTELMILLKSRFDENVILFRTVQTVGTKVKIPLEAAYTYKCYLS